MPNAISVAHKGAETKGGCLAVVSDIEFIFSPLSLSLSLLNRAHASGGNHAAFIPRNTQVDVYSFNSTFFESALEFLRFFSVFENFCGEIFRPMCRARCLF